MAAESLGQLPPGRGHPSSPGGGGLRAAAAAQGRGREPKDLRELSSSGQGEAWSRTAEPLKAQACGYGGMVPGNLAKREEGLCPG